MKIPQRLRSWIPRLSGCLAVACCATLCLLLLATTTVHASDCGSPGDCQAVADNANTATGIAGGIAGAAIGLAIIAAIRRNGRAAVEDVAAESEVVTGEADTGLQEGDTVTRETAGGGDASSRESDTVAREGEAVTRETDTGAEAVTRARDTGAEEGDVQAVEPDQPLGGSLPPEDVDDPRRTRRRERERPASRSEGAEEGGEEYTDEGGQGYAGHPSGTPTQPPQTPPVQPDTLRLQSDPSGGAAPGLQSDPAAGGSPRRHGSPGGGGGQQQAPPGGGGQEQPDVIPTTMSHALHAPLWLGGFYTPEQWVVIAAARRAKVTGLTIPQAQSLIDQARSVGLPTHTPDVPVGQVYPETVYMGVGPVEDIPVSWSAG